MEWLIIPNFMLEDRERWQLWLSIPGDRYNHPRFIFEGEKVHCFDIADHARRAPVVVQERINEEAKPEEEAKNVDRQGPRGTAQTDGD